MDNTTILVRKIVCLTMLTIIITGCNASSPPLVPENHIEIEPSNIQQVSLKIEVPEGLSDRAHQNVSPAVFDRSSENETTEIGQSFKNKPLESLPLPEADPFSLESLQSRALANHPALARAVAKAEALDGKMLQAQLPENPVIGYSAEEIGDGETAGKQGGFVRQKFITGHKKWLASQVVSQEVARAEQQMEMMRQKILTDVRLAYYDLLIAQDRMKTIKKLEIITKDTIKTSQALFDAKETTKVVLLQAKVEFQQMEMIAEKADNNLQAKWRRLALLIGDPDAKRQTLPGNLKQKIEPILWETTIKTLLNNSPEMAAAWSELARANWQLDREMAEVIPDVELELSVHHDNASGDTVGGIQVGFPLPLFNKNQGAISQAHSEVVAASHNIKRLELKLSRKLSAEIKRYHDAKYESTKYLKSIIPLAEESLKLVKKGYEQGEVDFLTKLTAQRTFNQVKLAEIDALQQFWASVSRIQGMLLEDSLSDDDSGATESR